jgi:hypothetical protein
MQKWIESKDGEPLDIDNFDWSIYCAVTQNTFTVQPHHILQHKSFRGFCIKSSDIPEGETIYPLYFGADTTVRRNANLNVSKVKK